VVRVTTFPITVFTVYYWYINVACTSTIYVIFEERSLSLFLSHSTLSPYSVYGLQQQPFTIYCLVPCLLLLQYVYMRLCLVYNINSIRMITWKVSGWVGLWHARERRKKSREFWWRKLSGKDTFENLEIERERMVLMWILNK